MNKVCRRTRILQNIVVAMAMVLLTLTVGTLRVYAAPADGEIKAFVQANAPVVKNDGTVVKDGTSLWTSDIASHFSTKVTTTNTISIVVQSDKGGASCVYYYSDKDETAIKDIISSIDEADNAAARVDDITHNLNVHADTTSGTQIVSPLVPVVNTFIGVVLLLIVMFMGAYTASDISFLAFPVVRQKLAGELEKGGNNALIKTDSKTGNAKYRWVTDDAVAAYEESVTDGTKGNPYLKYFVKHCWTYVCIGLLTYVLLTGKVEIFTSLGIKFGKGLINLIASL